VASDGQVHVVRLRSVLDGSVGATATSPVAVALLKVAQQLADRARRVNEVLVRPQPGRQAEVGSELRRLAVARHLDLRPADDELRLLSVATKPNRQSTSLFTAIAVMIGFLLALNAMLLTVPERRRFIADLRMQGYGPGQLMLLLGFQAIVLGVLASLIGVAAGDVLSHALFQRAPDFLSAAFPIGSRESLHAGTVLAAVGCGVFAVLVASLSPLLDLWARGPVDAAFREAGARSEIVRGRTILVLALLGVGLTVGATTLALLVPTSTIGGGVALAIACVCVVPAVFWGLIRWLPGACERVRSGALIVALSEMRATSTRSVALAAIVGLAVYGGIAIGGARSDLLNGIESATVQYFGTAQAWVTSGRDVFNTNSFSSAGPRAAIARLPSVAAVKVYQGGLLDVGERRMWVRARPPGDSSTIESTQLLEGEPASATRLIERGGWAGVSSDFASERHLRVGSVFALPTPSGTARLRVAAIVTNSGWPAGTLTLSAPDFHRLWLTSDASALEVSFKDSVDVAHGAGIVRSALRGYPGLQTRTSGERVRLSSASARQGLRTLGEISTLLLVTAALSVASALSATIWQRRPRLAALKMQGYDNGQLWRAVLIESAMTLGVGSVVGAVVGIGGHALASRFLQSSTGFPAPFSAGPAQVSLTIALFVTVALAVIALPGMVAARVSPRAVFQE
jgi:putative ABC transport system permease protein